MKARRALALLALLQGALACASPRPAERPRSPAPAPASSDELTAIGAAADADAADDDASFRKAEAFVRARKDAAAIAARALLHDQDEVRLKGARMVLLSLSSEDLASLDQVDVGAAANDACRVTDLVQLLGVSPLIDDPEGPPRFEPAYARLLVRIGDQAWPTCVKTCPKCETSRRRPEQVVTEILVETTPVRPEPPYLRDQTDEPNPDDEKAFRAWWKAHRAALLRERRR